MRGAASARRVNEMQRASNQYQEQAARVQARRAELDRVMPGLQQRQVQAQQRLKELQSPTVAALQDAKYKQALASYGVAQTAGGGTANAKAVAALTKASNERERYQKSIQTAANAEVAAQNRVNTALLRRTELEARIIELQHKSLQAAVEAAATETTRAQAALVMQTYARRKEQDAKEHGIRAGNAVSAWTMKAGAAGLVGLGGADVVGNQVNQMLLTIAHNTSLSDDGIKHMITTVKKLGEESGLSLEEIAQGYRKLENYGFDVAASEKLLSQAMKVSVAQGTDMSATTETLTRVMKEYNIPIQDGVKAMNVLVATSKLSARNMTELDEVYGRMSATASNFGVSMLDTSAAFITFTRHGLDAHDAMTQFVNIINKIQNPSKQVQQALRNIDAEAKKLGVSGIALANAFSPSGIRSLGVGGVFDMIKKAADEVLKVPAPDLDVKLFPQRRGQLGGAIAVGTGVKDWAHAIEEVKKRAEDGAAIDKQYQESLSQVNQQLDRLKNIGMDAASSISTALAPVIRDAIKYVQDLADKFNGLSDAEKTSDAKLFAWVATGALAAGAVGKLITGIFSLTTAMQALGITAAASIGAVSTLLAGASATAALIPVIDSIPGARRLATNPSLSNVKNLFKSDDDILNSDKGYRKWSQEQADLAAPNAVAIAPFQEMGKKITAARAELQRLQTAPLKFNEAGSGLGRENRVVAQKKVVAQLEEQFKQMSKATELHIKMADQVKKDKAAQVAAKAAADAMGLARKSTMPGADKLAGLYDHAHKPKKAKETEEQKTLDYYRNSIEELRKAEYKLVHSGLGDKEVEARWETMSHGSVAAKELKGNLEGVTEAMKRNYITMARSYDRHAKGVEIMKSLGEATSGFGSIMSKGLNEFRSRTDNDAASWMEKIAEPLGEKLSVHDRVLRDITKDTELVARKGMDWAKSMAVQAQVNTDAAEAVNQYDKALQEANGTLQKSKDESLGKQTHIEAFAVAAATKEYNKLNWVQKLVLYGKYALADAQDALNAKDKMATGLTTYLADEVKRSTADATRGIDPAAARRMDFERSAIDRYGAEAYGKLGPGDRSAIDRQIADAYQVVSVNDLQAESQKKIVDVMQKVKDKMAELTEKLKINTDGIQINQEQWDALTKAQQDNVQQTVQLAGAKDRIKSLMDGIDQVFTKTLEDVHEHGFRNFFRDVLNGFNDMCFQLAETWLNSQFVKLMANALGGNNTTNLFGGGKGTGSSGGGGGVLGSLLGSVANGILGGGFGGVVLAGQSGAGANIDFGLQSLGLSGLASGGSVFGDRSYIVGERGPELFTPRSSGRITPNGQFGGNTTFIMHVHGVTDAGSFNQSRHQITQDMVRAVQIVQRR
jgi:TP901 family phage tail tape measure protein